MSRIVGHYVNKNIIPNPVKYISKILIKLISKNVCRFNVFFTKIMF